MFLCHVVLPAGAVDMAWGSAAEAGTAVLPGSAGSLHRADPHLGLQAPPVRRDSRLHTRSAHCLLGGEYIVARLLSSVRVHMSASVKFLSRTCVFPRPSTSRPCLKTQGQICLRMRPWTDPCHPIIPSAKTHLHPPPACSLLGIDKRFEECEPISCDVKPHTSVFCVRERGRGRVELVRD